ncbi:DNA polymerase delta, subunit 4-domain-containing protein [Emericellopsis atlantica]|uniref:DNA polymerase delta, subunit 4-domain-containing protein n=1 Tax=Emericellopsis atlantica TaxID=2614577 RepID=A0A9P8CUN7_9HYPO|nr:DNA polymerase delta, subunit 4-domain-containing protein [Emericellopsis atlantica]KAG9257731.1 DNA polymerase delta, subunit 4-domain-containing protein [Emericellopsis atlantica]
MARTTRSTGPAKGQSTLSFHSKVTKNVGHNAKKAALSPSVSKVELPPTPAEADTVDDVTPTQVETEAEELEAEEEIVEPEPASEAELKAEKMTEAHINKYWKSIEMERMAPRVHQEGLSTHEKILRYFDVSSQYGPCIGITRTKRWQRAEKLGLNPPIEVLAVLLKEDKDKNRGFEKAQMDKIMGSIAVGATA